MVGLASIFGAILVVVGAFLMALGYGNISQCISLISYANCWDPFHVPYRRDYNFQTGDIEFYVGAIISIIGTVLLAGPSLARSFRKLSG